EGRGLGDGELAALRSHLDACEVCRALEAWQAIGTDETTVNDLSSDPAVDDTLSADAARGSAPSVDAASGSAPRVSLAALTHEAVRGQSIGLFLVLDVLGAGGMGVVYSGYDPDLDRKVAIKVLRTDAGGEDRRTRLLREAQAMARINHPN